MFYNECNTSTAADKSYNNMCQEGMSGQVCKQQKYCEQFSRRFFNVCTILRVFAFFFQ